MNASHFNETSSQNHSCDPNCTLNACYINDSDIDKPLLAVFTQYDVEPGEELCFSYSGPPDENALASPFLRPLLAYALTQCWDSRPHKWTPVTSRNLQFLGLVNAELTIVQEPCSHDFTSFNECHSCLCQYVLSTRIYHSCLYFRPCTYVCHRLLVTEDGLC